jgi:hypothetical protein
MPLGIRGIEWPAMCDTDKYSHQKIALASQYARLNLERESWSRCAVHSVRDLGQKAQVLFFARLVIVIQIGSIRICAITLELPLSCDTLILTS